MKEDELNETQIHSRPAGGSLSFSLVSAVNKAALHLFTLICIIQRQYENKKYPLNFSKDSKFPSDIYSYKLLPLTESRFVEHLNRFESSHIWIDFQPARS